jgi:hypothetical protein
MHNRGLPGPFTKLLAVIANSLDRATFFGLSAACFFFGIFGLLIHEGIAAVVVAFEIIGGRFATEIAVNALIVDVEFAAGIFGVSVRNVSHKVLFSCQVNMLSPISDGKRSMHKELSNTCRKFMLLLWNLAARAGQR